MKYCASLILSMACLITCSQVLAAAKVYKWVDDRGVVHYSAQPPLNTPTQVVKPQIGHSDPVTYTSSSSAAADAKNPPAAEGNASLKDKDRCEAAHTNKDTLATFTHIKIKDENGEYRYLTPEEQQQKLDEANKAIEQSCE